jgi:hypothetical protein
LQAGFYSFGQHDDYLFGAIFNEGSESPNISTPNSVSGGVIEEYVSYSYKATSWLTVIAGLRQTTSKVSSPGMKPTPRFGVAVRVPRLNWIFQGFYGHF